MEEKNKANFMQNEQDMARLESKKHDSFGELKVNEA